MEKREKDIREIEYLELRKKAKENKAMTPEEQKKLSSYRNREIVNQVLIAFGLVMAAFVFILTLDLFTDGSLWAYIFGNDPIKYWGGLYDGGYLEIFRVIFQDRGSTAVFAMILYTVVHAAVCVAFIFIFAFAIKDLINLIRKAVKGTGELVKGIAGTAKDSIDNVEKDGTTLKEVIAKKKAAKETVKTINTTITEPKKKAGPKKKIEDKHDYESLSDEDLAKMLSGEVIAVPEIKEEPEVEERRSEEHVTKPLFPEEK